MAKKKVTIKKTSVKKAAPKNATQKKANKEKANKKKISEKSVSAASAASISAAKLSAAKVTAKALLGTTIGAFSVLNAQGAVFTQDDLRGRKTVLYFYPKDDTPGCTLEGQQFSALKSAFDKHNTAIFGVSKDSSKSHDKFMCKYGFKFDLLADENEKLCKIFDVIKEKNMYGRKYMGIERSTFVLDENLQVIKEMRKVSPDGHAQDVLDFVKSL
ncbi:MAG: peroxiredoxin [Bdellovibrionaceae bacterium]|nr:peroxiredoxin [Pseudobdellovibrionaceae bacterium]